MYEERRGAYRILVGKSEHERETTWNMLAKMGG
jgi:hypothetical protein